MISRTNRSAPDTDNKDTGKRDITPREVAAMLKEGLSKEEVYKDLHERVDPETLARILASIPDKGLYRKYGKLNGLLVALLCLSAAGKFLELLLYLINRDLNLLHLFWTAPLGLLFNMVLFYIALKRIGIAYRFLGGFVFLSILPLFESVRRLTSPEDLVLFASVVGMNLVIGALFLFLGRKMFPYFRFIKVSRDSEGLIIYTAGKE